MTETKDETVSALLRLDLRMESVRRWYDTYSDDVAYYKSVGRLVPDHADAGYRTGTPIPFEEYAQEILEGCLLDVVGEHTGFTVVRADG